MNKALEIIEKYRKRHEEIEALLDQHFPGHKDWKGVDQEIVELDLPADPLCPMAFVEEVYKGVLVPRHSTGATCSGIRKTVMINNREITYHYRGYCHLCYCPGEYLGWNFNWHRSKEWKDFYKGETNYNKQLDLYRKIR